MTAYILTFFIMLFFVLLISIGILGFIFGPILIALMADSTEDWKLLMKELKEKSKLK